VRDDVFKADMRKYNKMLPECLSKEDEDWKEGLRPIRPARLGKFVLDDLLDHGKRIWEDYDAKYQTLKSKTFSRPNDPDLLRPYEEAKSGFTSPPHSEQLEILKKHVQKCKADWGNLRKFSRSPASPNARAQADAKQKKSSAVADIKKEFATGPPPESIVDLYSGYRGSRMVKEIKASFAYSLGEKFAFAVAFHDICSLKARANDDEYPVHGKFRDVTAVSSSVARRYNAHKANRGAEPR
jgi:RNA-dependent RNA polymerase